MSPIRLLPLILPALLVVFALVMPSFMFGSDQGAEKVGLGPGAWPSAALMGLGAFSALWLLRDILIVLGSGWQPSLIGPSGEDSYNYAKAVLGIVLILAYGWLLPLTGFALTTSAFIAIWCAFGGVRNPFVVVPVALLGTYVLLWVFMGLALMPLSRGQGVFDSISVWLLQVLRIY